MKKINFLLIASMALLISCSSSTKSIKDTKSVTELGSALESEFGADAYYTSISFVGSDIGVITSATVTKDPASLKMGEWGNVQGTWTQSSEVSLEIPEGAEASDFMFQINKKVDFKLLGKLVEESINKIKTEKEIKDVIVSSIFMNAPDDGDFDEMKYFITLEPANGGTSFKFFYKLDGTLDSFDY